MNNYKKIITLICLLIAGYSGKAGVLMNFPFAGSMVEILDSAGAAMENLKSDEYTKALTPFDLSIRLGRKDAAEKDYLARAAEQARTWSEEEQQEIKKSFGEIETFLKANNIKLNLPAKILMLKTAGKEEFEAEGYTRGNRIMLYPNSRQPLTTHVIAHELFHVYSRMNEKKRNDIYAIFGFRKCNRINTATAIGGRMITNPDCPFIEHYITLNLDDKSTDMVLQLYSKKDYNEAYTLGDYANLGLLEVAGLGTEKKPVLKNGTGIVYGLEQVPDLFQHIGTNTSYILHPEEISAEHFAMWVIGQKVPQPEFFEKLKSVLK